MEIIDWFPFSASPSLLVFNNKFPFVLGERLGFSFRSVRQSGNNERAAMGDFPFVIFFQQYFIIYCLQNPGIGTLSIVKRH
jgi:hypothetical protein